MVLSTGYRVDSTEMETNYGPRIKDQVFRRLLNIPGNLLKGDSAIQILPFEKDKQTQILPNYGIRNEKWCDVLR